MLATPAIETDAEFRARIKILVEKTRTSKEPVSLTIDGEEQAVLVPPTMFDEMSLVIEDQTFYATVRIAMQEYKDGKGMSVAAASKQIREELTKFKAEQSKIIVK